MVIELSPIFVTMIKALPAIFAIAGVTWLISLYLHKISIIYYSWPVLLMVAALLFQIDAQTIGAVQLALLAMVCCWALRLNYYAIKRGRHQPEDRRYRALRENSSSSFGLHSFSLILVAQPVLASMVSSLFAIVIIDVIHLRVTVLIWCDASGYSLLMASSKRMNVCWRTYSRYCLFPLVLDFSLLFEE